MEDEKLKLPYDNMFFGKKEGIGYLSVGANWCWMKGSVKIHQV